MRPRYGSEDEAKEEMNSKTLHERNFVDLPRPRPTLVRIFQSLFWLVGTPTTHGPLEVWISNLVIRLDLEPGRFLSSQASFAA